MANKEKKNKKMPIHIMILFLIGFLVMIYPLISRTYYDYRGNEEVNDYQEELAKIPTAEIQDRLQLAYAYNNAILSGDERSLGDPFSDDEKEKGVSNYARLLEVKEKIGILTVPKINTKFPVYAGTSETVLQKGVGHLEGTSLPVGGLTTHSVLTAHRGLPENKLFTDLDKMEVEDLFFIETIAGKLAYKVIKVKVIEPTAFEEVSIEKDKDLVTLLTCTPYMINSHRLIVVGERTKIPAEDQEELSTISWWDHIMTLFGGYIWILLGAVILLILYIGRKFLRNKGENSHEKEEKD